MAQTFRIKLIQGHRSMFTDLDRRVTRFQQAELAARRDAAQMAQAVSRAQSPARRPIAPPRNGRAQSSRLKTNIDWKTGAVGGRSIVRLDTDKLNRLNPYWVIQEIGTGKRATIKRGGVTN